jgi:hypothetical protein
VTERNLLISALHNIAGFTYDNSARPAPRTQDCTRYAYAILRDLYGDRVEEYKAELHIVDPAHVWSNVDAVLSLGGKSVAFPSPGHWHYCQGWKSTEPLRGGHAWLWYEPPAPVVEPGLIVQATPAKAPWCEYRSWGEQAGKFPAGVRLAVLPNL